MSLRAYYVRTCHSKRLLNSYEFERQLGEGAKGRVMQVKHKLTGMEYAVKIMCKTTQADIARQEASIMKSLDHPNLGRLYELFEDDDCIYLLLKQCKGGQLLDLLVTMQSFGEAEAALLMRQLLQAVRHMQRRRVCHADISMVNLMCSTADPITRHNANSLRLIDFGSAFRLNETDLRDLQSCGRIMSTLLLGNIEGEVSKSGQDLVKWLIAADPSTRPTAKEALRHEWFTAFLPRRSKRAARVPRNMVSALQTFSGKSALRKAASIVMAEHISGDQLKMLRDGFSAMDRNGDGVLTVDELRSALNRCGVKPPADLLQLLKCVDPDRVGVLEYTAFLAAMVDCCKFEEAVCYEAVFSVFDTDNDGTLNREQLTELLRDQEIGFAMEEKAVETYMESVDEDSIDLDLFFAKLPERRLCLKHGSTRRLDATDMDFQPFLRRRCTLGDKDLERQTRSSVLASKLAAVTPRHERSSDDARTGGKKGTKHLRCSEKRRLISELKEAQAENFNSDWSGRQGESDIANLEDLLDDLLESSSEQDGDSLDGWDDSFECKRNGDAVDPETFKSNLSSMTSTAYYSSGSLGSDADGEKVGRPPALFSL
eukprot:TRINITY_DN14347_c0_g1_i1.p1 TRINITY_DN14347_c0_g1~~TRINITY_DN14347_c0_g1_i1.p1  ORF type:complete len:598 (-),score=141.88 TRINITY_DN14347_c0_g1_i1:146-1939(-)